jgi:hypothetical protein
MTEQNHTRAVHLQSSAVVLAALITTCGAVTAALIQTGWIRRPPPEPVASLSKQPASPIDRTAALERWSVPRESTEIIEPSVSPEHTTVASFTGAIEPLAERPLGTTQMAAVTVAQPTSDPTSPSATKWNTNYSPNLLPSHSISGTWASPWDALKSSTVQQTPAASVKPAQKSADWRSITRFFTGN